jgi:hypothetical protein
LRFYRLWQFRKPEALRVDEAILLRPSDIDLIIKIAMTGWLGIPEIRAAQPSWTKRPPERKPWSCTSQDWLTASADLPVLAVGLNGQLRQLPSRFMGDPAKLAVAASS